MKARDGVGFARMCCVGVGKEKIEGQGNWEGINCLLPVSVTDHKHCFPIRLFNGLLR